MAEGQFSFNDDFQNLILACLIRHPDKFLMYGNILKPSHFNGVMATVTAKCALNFYEKNSRFPKWTVLHQLVTDEYKKIGDDPDSLPDYIQSLKELETDDVDYVVQRLILFCRERETISAIRKSIALIQEGKAPDHGFVKMFEDALKVGENLDDLGYIFHQDYRQVIDKVTKQDYGIKTGYPQYDGIWKRGWGPGWLIVPLAPPKRFKSTWALNLALNMVGESVGEDVLYYCCEISAEETFVRGMCRLTGIKRDDMYDSPDRFSDSVKRQLGISVAGSLIMKAYPSKTAKISDIKAHAKTCIQQLGIRPKAIVIDYAETIAPSDLKQSEHQQSANIYVEARAMGQELGCCVIMPDRCNKETVDSPVPSMKSFQGSFQKAGAVDIAIGLCATDEEYSQNILRTFVFLNRHGAAYQHFKGKVDPETMQIDIGKQIEYDPDDEGDAGKKKRSGRKKGKDFKKLIDDDDDVTASADSVPDDLT